VKRALELEQNDGEIWAISSRLNSMFMSRAFDNSGARREPARSQAERALKLAPDSVESLLAVARANRNTDAPRAEAALRQALALAPHDGRVLLNLGSLFRVQNRLDEALGYYEQAAAVPEVRPLARYDQFLVTFYQRKFADAERYVQESVTALPTANSVTGLAMVKLTWRGQPEEALRVLAAAPGKVRAEPRPVIVTVLAAQMNRQPEEALAALRRFPAEYVNDAWYAGPKALLVGLGELQAGRPEAARVAWESGIALLRRRMQDTPNNAEEHLRLGELLAWSGQTEAALGEVRVYEQLTSSRTVDWTVSPARVYAALGRADEVVPLLAKELVAPPSGRWPLTPALLRLDPLWDKIRGDPRFQKLCEEPSAQTAAPAVRPADKSIAVLPFTNMSEDQGGSFFADGMHEDILTNLAVIRDLRVTSRTSVMEYRGTTKKIRQIGAELGVAYVLEGSVRRAGNKVRVTGQLINVATDEHLWARSYDRDLTDIFAIQSELSQAIATALAAVLTPQEKSLLEARPTTSLAAYDLFLKARAWHQGYDNIAHRGQVEQWLHEAVRLDPAFAQAWALLSNLHLYAYIDDADRTPERLAQAKSTLDTAVQLAPGDPLVIECQGTYFYHGFKDYAQAAGHYRRLLVLNPNSAIAYGQLGFLERRQGRWPEALALIQKSVQLDPRNPTMVWEVGDLTRDLRRYDDAATALRQAERLAPEDPYYAYEARQVAFNARGSTREVEDWLAGTKVPAALANSLLAIRRDWTRQSGDYATAVRLNQENPNIETYRDPRWKQEVEAARDLLGHHDSAGAAARAQSLIPELQQLVEKQATNAYAWQALAWLHVITGDREPALRCARRMKELLPESVDAKEGPGVSRAYAAILAWTGDKDGALAELARLLRTPRGANVHWLRAGVDWLPLRGDPRFEALLNDPKNNAPLF
jgi:TolB-like protein/Tfp pilus assembly protein PilF